MKRILIIVGILIAAVVVVTIGVFLRDNGAAPAANPTESLPLAGGLPIAGDEGIGGNIPGENSGAPSNDAVPGGGGLPIAGVEAVAQAAVIDYTVNPQGEATFLASNGAVIHAPGAEAIGQANFGDILSAKFSPDGKWLLVKSASGSVTRWDLLDIAKKTWKSIPASAGEMVWSPSGDRLAYFATRANANVLSVYNPTTGATGALLTLSAPDLKLRWKDAGRIFVMDHPNSRLPGAIWEFRTDSGALVPFVKDISGGDILWGGARHGGLVFRAGPTSGTLTIVSAEGITTQTANFLTLPSKCVFGESAPTSTIAGISDYLFCAIPKDQQLLKERPLPDDYLMGKFGTADSLYAIDLARGTLAQILPASESFVFDAENLKVYGDSLYFVNRNDKKLYKVSLSVLPSELGSATDGS